MPSLRLQRVRELLKRQIGEVIRRELPIDQAGIITVNDVEVSPDLHSATVFVGVVGTEEQRKRGLTLLQNERKKIQGMVGRAIVLKYTPQLRFVMDESVSRGNRVLEILDEIERSSSTHEGSSEDH
ncbi:MAG: 30S ribosome-binding factor RbfA [Verrucomicrobia bacterium]|nr:30S ribosome-binding factor RbfA [Verrucomicrobiota bacterium]